MPENWKTYKLGELSTLGDGAHSKIKRIDHGILYLTSKNFKEGRLKLDNIDYISENDYARLFSVNSKAVNKPTIGDVLIGIIGTLGNAYLYKENDKFGISSSVAIIRPDNTKLNSLFLYYCITGKEFKHFQSAHNGASAQGYTNLPSLRTIPISIPPLQEQKSIASILSALDDKIELNLQMNKTLEEMAMALYKHWFVDFGPFKNAKFVESELGMIPEGWEVKSINSFGKIVCGKTPSKKDENNFTLDEGYPFIKIPDMHGNVFVFETMEKISEKGTKIQLNKLLPSGSINVSCIATVGLVTINSIPAHTNQQINSIIPNNASLKYYVYISMLNLKERFMNEASGGSATLNMNTSTFSAIELLKPLDTELKKFDLLVSNFFEQIESNTIENKTLTTLRDTLLPKLISGSIRVKDVEQLVQASL